MQKKIDSKIDSETKLYEDSVLFEVEQFLKLKKKLGTGKK